MSDLDIRSPLSEEPSSDEKAAEIKPTEETSTEETPTEETPTEEISTEETPAEETPIEETSIEETSIEETSAEETPAEETVSDPVPETIYRWSYAEEVAHRSRRKGKGILVYASIMTAVFLLSFGLLLAVLFLDRDSHSLRRPDPSVSSEVPDDSVAAVENAKRSVVVIEVRTEGGGGTGTGIIMTEDGYIATNHHVIEGATQIRVTFYDGTVMTAETVGSSEMDDLAVIKVNGRDLPVATFAYSEDCYVGQVVYAIGTPAGPDFGWTTTKGIISYKDREVKIYNETDGSLQKKLRLLQTDANVNPGNSGGPLVNTSGQVVGVVSMKLANGYEGIGFAIPSDGATEILRAIMRYGNADSINSSLHHKRPMLGITGVYVEGGEYYLPNETGVRQLTPEELESQDKSLLLHPQVSGVYVMGFAEGMDAANKMKVGDIITACQGEELLSMTLLTHILNEHYAGDTITLTVYRDGKTMDVDIVLSAQSSNG